MSSRLFRSIIAFGASLGIGTGVATVATLASGCDLYWGDPKDGRGHTGWPIIDASQPGCHYDGYCDAGWPTISDAPWGIIDAPAVPDAAPDARPPDAHVTPNGGST